MPRGTISTDDPRAELPRPRELLGVAALKQLDGRHAEIKSIHTVEAARGRGVGRAIART